MSGRIPDHLEPALRDILLDWVDAVGVDGAWARLLTILKGDEKLAREVVAELFGAALPVPEPAPAPGPAPGPALPAGDWAAALRAQLCFFDGPAYFWADVREEEIRPWLMMMRNAGISGPEIEFNGAFPVFEYNGEGSSHDVAQFYEKSFRQWHLWLPVIRELGLVANLKFLNSNQSSAGRQTDQFWFSLAQRFAREFGPANMIVMPLNESDPRTREGIRSAITSGLMDGGFSRGQLVGWLNKGENGFVENHPKNFDGIQAGDHTRLNIPDNGPMIQTLYGSAWRNGGSPNTGNIQKYITLCRKKGTSTGIYSFRRIPDVVGLQSVGQALLG